MMGFWRILKQAFHKWSGLTLYDQKVSSVRESSRFGPPGFHVGYNKKERQHGLSTLIDSLSPVAQELVRGWLETQEYKKLLERDTKEALGRAAELAKVLTEVYHIDLEQFNDLLKLEENL